MALSEEFIRKALEEGQYVDSETLSEAFAYAEKHHAPVQDYLYKQELLTVDLFGQAIAEAYGVPYADLNSNMPSKELLEKLSADIAKQYNAVVFQESENALVVTTFDPKQEGLQEALQEALPGKTIEIHYSDPNDIADALSLYRTQLETRFSKILESSERVAPEILDEIFDDAITLKASDIHFEPQEEEVLIRFRVDGVLQEAGRLQKQYYDTILNRVKVQSHMRIDEHLATQDGALRHESNNRITDMRVSIVPTVEGEKIVLRVLSSYVEGLTLANLGLSESQQDTLVKASKKPFGMILVTGPTGSGKTTTLYAVLQTLNSPDVNVTTIEDPVEYKMNGLNQIQVNTQTELTFAKGLRSIVRQDPDIILVGEIRDTETAEIAVNAALTGHLLLSTFHANDAPTAIPRLLDMGIEPFLLASTLETVLAQRLVRKICDNCRLSEPVNMAALEQVFPEAKTYFADTKTLYKGKGCSVCHGTGYKGRMAIFEFVAITPEMETLIMQEPSSQDIWKLARQQGSTTLFEDGVEKIKQGVTTLEELLRVASQPTDM